MVIGLNRARLAPEGDRFAEVAAIAPELAKVKDPRERARFGLNLAAQASAFGPRADRIAYESLETARAAAAALPDDRMLAEALDGLGALYESHGRSAEALRLTDQGLAAARRAEARELLVTLEARRGRLLKRSGQPELALAAYQRAAEHIETIRPDIPVQYEDGTSSYRKTLEPVYLGLADLLLQQAETADASGRAAYYRQARDTVELIKQTELEDFLGDRCTVGSVQRIASNLPARTAVLYPVILEDRLDLLVETPQGLQRRSVAVARAQVEQTARALAAQLRNKREFEQASRQLYDWLLRPVVPILDQAGIDNLIFVPDGVLRLVPIGALHDGSRFVVQRYAAATVPGMTMTARDAPGPRRANVLLAGLSEPGPVVSKLPASMFEKRTAADAGLTTSPSLPRSRALPADGGSALSDTERRKSLALPGVKEEVRALGQMVKGYTLLDETFTLNAFSERVSGGDYRIVHIASHGWFSSSAQTSFILTYDELLTLDGLQALLRSERLQHQPIDLLTLSACQTAEGDERAPLGLAGAALKARAASALGTLWPVADDAAKTLMPGFYKALAEPGATKIKALQKGQVALLAQSAFSHPYYWAPFILVGSWQ